MNFQKLETPSLKELFITELETKILSGELPIGTKLPSERELAASMQVSRAVVNSGISEMEKKGFLVVKPRIGTFVEDYRRNGTLDTLVSIMHFHGGNIGRKEVRSILELRIVLVNLAASLSVDQADDEELQSLVPLLHDIQNSTTNDEVVENTFRLYHELSYISGNMLLPLFFMSFRELVCPLWTRFVMNYGRDALVQRSERFMELLLARKKEELLEHISQSSKDSIDGAMPIY